MHEEIQWARIAEAHGFHLQKVAPRTFELDFSNGSRLRLEGAHGDYWHVSGAPGVLKHLKGAFACLEVDDALLVVTHQLGSRLESACSFVDQEACLPGPRDPDAPGMPAARIALARERKDLLAREGDSEAVTEVKRRRGQSLLADILYAQYGRCFVTGLSRHALLVASHIKPWRDSKGGMEAERLDEDNVLLLSVAYDKLFDRGFITFRDDGSLEYCAEAITPDELRLLGVDVSRSPGLMESCLNSKRCDFLAYHRKHVFAKKCFPKQRA